MRSARLVLHAFILMTLTETQIQISTICDDVKELLLYKNKKYGNSALEPARIFSKASPVEQILVRIDDKLSRIKSGDSLLDYDEDVIMDLIGYLVLLKIALIKEDVAASQIGQDGV